MLAHILFGSFSGPSRLDRKGALLSLGLSRRYHLGSMAMGAALTLVFRRGPVNVALTKPRASALQCAGFRAPLA